MTRVQAHSVAARDDYMLDRFQAAGAFDGAETGDSRPNGEPPDGPETATPPSYSCRVKKYGSLVLPVFSLAEIARYGRRE